MGRYKSNVMLGQLTLPEHFDNSVAVIKKNDNYIIDGTIHMCITQKALDSTVSEFRKKFADDKIEASSTVIGVALDTAFAECEAVHIYGLAPYTLIITVEDMEPIRGLTDSFCTMYAYTTGKLPLNKVYNLLKDKPLYFLGEPLTPASKTFGVTTIPRENGDKKYNSVTLFLTEESAKKYNHKNVPVTLTTLETMHSLWKGTYALIIEPYRNYWVEFDADSVIS